MVSSAAIMEDARSVYMRNFARSSSHYWGEPLSYANYVRQQFCDYGDSHIASYPPVYTYPAGWSAGVAAANPPSSPKAYNWRPLGVHNPANYKHLGDYFPVDFSTTGGTSYRGSDNTSSSTYFAWQLLNNLCPDVGYNHMTRHIVHGVTESGYSYPYYPGTAWPDMFYVSVPVYDVTAPTTNPPPPVS